MKYLSWKSMFKGFKGSGRMSFTNIAESRMDILLKMHSKTFLLQLPHRTPCLLITGQKWEMNLIKI